MHNHIVCTCVASYHCGLASAFSDALLCWMNSHTLYSDDTSLHCGWADVGKGLILWLKRSRTICINLVSLRNVFWCDQWTQLDTIVSSFFAVSHYAIRSPAWLNDWTLVHLASTVGERMSLNFDFVLLRSGTFNTVAFDKLEALYFKDFFNFLKEI